MPAPHKKGLDYFSHDVNMSFDDKVEYLEAKHGIIGYAIYQKLLEKIYSNGYYVAWNEMSEAIFAKRLNVELTIVQEVIASCIKGGLFNKKVFLNKGLLTSSGIQRRFLKATERRKTLTSPIREDINSLEVNEYINLVNVRNNGVNVALTRVNGSNNSQSKVKESKVKERKGKGIAKGKGKDKKKKKKGVYRGSGLTLRQFRREEKGWNELLDQLQEDKTPRGVSRYEKLIAEGIEKGFKRREKK